MFKQRRLVRIIANNAKSAQPGHNVAMGKDSPGDGFCVEGNIMSHSTPKSQLRSHKVIGCLNVEAHSIIGMGLEAHMVGRGGDSTKRSTKIIIEMPPLKRR